MALSLREIVAKNARKFRDAENMTLLEASKKSGLSFRYLQNIEKGDRWPSDSMLEALAKTYKKRPIEFFKEK